MGPIKIFGQMAPIARGLGLAVVSVGLFLAFYYNVVVSWSIWYLAASLSPRLEWAHCGHWYNSPSCWSPTTNTSRHLTSAPAEYYERYVLGNRGHNWHNFGHLRPQSVACLAAAWGVVALCLIKGIKTSGKIAYFTSLFPYVVLIVLAGRGLSLPGAGDGLHYYLTPDWTRLSDPTVWVDAATQVIFSLGPGENTLLSTPPPILSINETLKGPFILN